MSDRSMIRNILALILSDFEMFVYFFSGRRNEADVS